KSRVGRDLADGEAAFREQARGAARRQDLDVTRRESARELHEAALVGDGEQRAPYRQHLRLALTHVDPESQSSQIQRPDTWTCPAAAGRALGKNHAFCPKRRWAGQEPGSSALDHSMGEAELLQLLAQGAAIDAENPCCPALVAVRVIEDHAKEGLLDLAQHQVVKIRRARTVEAREVIAQSALGVAAQRQQRPLR